MQSPEYQGVDVKNGFYKLSIEEHTKPCLFLVTDMQDAEYYAMLAMNLFSKTTSNMVSIDIVVKFKKN